MIVSARACVCVCGCACVYFRITLYANLLTELFSMVSLEMKQRLYKKKLLTCCRKKEENYLIHFISFPVATIFMF